MTILEIKKLSKEEFLKLEDATEDLYNALQKSKPGHIQISRETDRAGICGFTEAFGEGISCSINNASRWYRTSVIQKIDWDNKVFDTLNSRYKFNFTEHYPEDYEN